MLLEADPHPNAANGVVFVDSLSGCAGKLHHISKDGGRGGSGGSLSHARLYGSASPGWSYGARGAQWTSLCLVILLPHHLQSKQRLQIQEEESLATTGAREGREGQGRAGQGGGPDLQGKE